MYDENHSNDFGEYLQMSSEYSLLTKVFARKIYKSI